MATDIGMLKLQRLLTAPNPTKQFLMNGISNVLNYHYFRLYIFLLKRLYLALMIPKKIGSSFIHV